MLEIGSVVTDGIEISVKAFPAIDRGFLRFDAFSPGHLMPLIHTIRRVL